MLFGAILARIIYGYRYYSPEIGRWISRDPIEEDGGYNLYEFVKNQSVNFVDSDGRFLFPIFIDPYEIDPSIAPPIKGEVTFNIKDYVENISTGSITIGVELYRTGELRLNYSELATNLKAAGLSDQEASAARDAIKAEFRKKQTKLGKEMTKKILEHRKKTGFKSSGKNPTKTNIKVNALAKVYKNTGRALAIVGITIEVATVASAPEGERLEEGVRAGGRIAGGFAGAAYGAELGSSGGPWGVAGGIVAGGIIGSIGGEAIVELFCGENESK